MRKLIRLFLVCASVTALFGSHYASAQVDRSLEGDKKCTACHDENWPKPILTIYQTKHGVKGDKRTPGCQGCHGESAEHQGDPGSKSPQVVFGSIPTTTSTFSPGEIPTAATARQHLSDRRLIPQSQAAASQRLQPRMQSPKLIHA